MEMNKDFKIKNYTYQLFNNNTVHLSRSSNYNIKYKQSADYLKNRYDELFRYLDTIL